MEDVFLSVIVPAYNETKNMTSGELQKVYNYLTHQGYGFELILVDDGSSDGTLDELQTFAIDKPQVQVLGQPHRGKGPTVQAGMLKATGKNRLFTDFDQSTPISEVEKLLPFRSKDYDVVIGSREVKGSRRDNEPWYRHLMGRVFNLVVNVLTIQGIHDTQCGFKMFSAEAAEILFPHLKIYESKHELSDPFTGAFDVELLYLANKMGMRIAEVPVHWKHVETERVSPIKDSLRMFVDVVKIRLADLSGRYEV